MTDFAEQSIAYEAPRSLPEILGCHEPRGISPSGTMKIKLIKDCPLNNDGSKVPALQIRYEIPKGQQKSYHSNPGAPFQGTERVAYLPFNKEGKVLLDRFVYAFEHGLIFSVGTSLTTKESNTVVWSQIPHKTSLKGGPFGYPDHGYLQKANGVLDSLHVPEAEKCRRLRAAAEASELQSLPTSVLERDEMVPTEVASSVIGSPIAVLPIAVPAIPAPHVAMGFIEEFIFYEAPDSLRDVVCGQGPRGTSPSGTMSTKLLKDCPLNNYGPNVAALQIQYEIPNGLQKSFHTNPGTPFQGTSRVAYLPFTIEGKNLLDRFVYAFQHGLIFSVGTSLTTKKSNTVVWSQIPHKTSLKGGPFGYPDDGYLQRANDVLDSLHVPDAEKCRHLQVAAKSAESAGAESVVAASGAPAESAGAESAVAASGAPAVLAGAEAVSAMKSPATLIDLTEQTEIYVAPDTLTEAEVGQKPSGTSPSGFMKIRLLKNCHCPGFRRDDGSSVEVIQLEYLIPFGFQKGYHYHPGTQFSGTRRVAYLPSNKEGKEVLDRMICAFRCGLVFSIGTSASRGVSDTVIWATIPHKTSLRGGPFGYPDDGYLKRVNDILDRLNVPNSDSCRQLRNAEPSEPRTVPISLEAVPKTVDSSASSAYAGPTAPEAWEDQLQVGELYSNAPIQEGKHILCREYVQCVHCRFDQPYTDNQFINHLEERIMLRMKEMIKDTMNQMGYGFDRVMTGLKNSLKGELRCPTLALLIPIPSENSLICWSDIVNWGRSATTKRFNLYFLCAHDYSCVDAPIVVEKDRKWVKIVTPFLRASILALAVAVVGGLAQIAIPQVKIQVDNKDFLEYLFALDKMLVDATEMDEAKEQGVNELNKNLQKAKISSEAYEGLSKLANNPQNMKWKEKMVLAERNGEFAWVKKENEERWKGDSDSLGHFVPQSLPARMPASHFPRATFVAY